MPAPALARALRSVTACALCLLTPQFAFAQVSKLTLQLTLENAPQLGAQVRASWDAGTPAFQGDTVSGYPFQMRRAGGAYTSRTQSNGYPAGITPTASSPIFVEGNGGSYSTGTHIILRGFLEPGVTYEARVQGFDSGTAISGPWSDTVAIVIPPVPAGLQTAFPAGGGAKFSWSAVPAESQVTYEHRIRWRQSGGDWLNTGAADGMPVSATMHTLPALTLGAHYDFHVSARASGVIGGWAGVSVQPGGVDAPQLWTSTDHVRAAWQAAPGASGYRVRWASADAPVTYQNAGGADAECNDADASNDADCGESASATTYLISGLAAAATYDVEIGAVHSGGVAWSDAARAVTGAFRLDVDGVAGAGVRDGIFIARYVLGLRGRALTDGFPAPPDAAALAAHLDHHRTHLNVDGDEVTAADGILIARYLLGVTGGAALTDGQADAADETDIVTAISALAR